MQHQEVGNVQSSQRKDDNWVSVSTKLNKSSIECTQRLFENEKSLRKRVTDGYRGNRFISSITNGYSAILVFVLYLISFESLLSIGLSVYFTICKLKANNRCQNFTMNPSDFEMSLQMPITGFKTTTHSMDQR